MNDDEPLEQIINDTLYGMIAALQVSLRALTLSHPDPRALIMAFQREHEQTMALLLAQDTPEDVLDMYRTTLFAISPNTDIAP